MSNPGENAPNSAAIQLQNCNQGLPARPAIACARLRKAWVTVKAGFSTMPKIFAHDHEFMSDLFYHKPSRKNLRKFH